MSAGESTPGLQERRVFFSLSFDISAGYSVGTLSGFDVRMARSLASPCRLRCT